MQNPRKSADQRAIPVLSTPARSDARGADGDQVDEVLRSQHYGKSWHRRCGCQSQAGPALPWYEWKAQNVARASRSFRLGPIW